MTVQVLDLFSGPGGLGEGFASLDGGKAFQIAISAEMEISAFKTLSLRAFFRLAVVNGEKQAIDAYYRFCNQPEGSNPLELFPDLAALALSEARQLTLGDPASNTVLDDVLRQRKFDPDRTVLIGGPPCQAYSLVGRARNKGTAGYLAEDDHRHFLYREYLRILAKTRPAVFVMENVKGILSSNVGGRKIFHDILTDLRDPVRAISGGYGPRYVIHSLVNGTTFGPGMEPSDIDARDFIVKAEQYGIPQARHRVILLGVRQDVEGKVSTLKQAQAITVRDAIGSLPHLRSRLSTNDSPEKWESSVSAAGRRLSKSAKKLRQYDISERLGDVAGYVQGDMPTGSLRFPRWPAIEPVGQSSFERWVKDKKISVWLNHEARSHMESDLGRYLYASVFAELNSRSPKGHLEFLLDGLAPDHANWESGKFVDRFRVQPFGVASTTVTSHIAKDGHYFIHPDPVQCRSLTVREAARLQTFPDNYFFLGNRTQQYHQVGNAVPPLLARQIAKIVHSIIG